MHGETSTRRSAARRHQPAAEGRRPGNTVRIALALGFAALLLAGCANTGSTSHGASDRTDWGIRVESLRLTAEDRLLDLRFRITDPERAAPLFSREAEIQLVDPAKGARLSVPNSPRLGKLRELPRREIGDRSYFMLFANPGLSVRPGARLTLVIGERRLENLRVEGAGGHHEPRPKL